MEKSVKIMNEEGMHARPAGAFAKKASEFKSNINVKINGQSKNAKSMMSIMSLGLKFGDEITIDAQGEDADTAVNELTQLVESKFHL